MILPLLLALTRTITKIFCVDSKENVWRLAFTDNRLWSRSGSSTLEENSRYFGRKFMFFESDAIILQVYICIVDVKNIEVEIFFINKNIEKNFKNVKRWVFILE